MTAIVRVFLCLFAIAAFAWGSSNILIFWEQSSIESIAGRIISGFPYKLDTLQGLKPAIEEAERLPRCRPLAARGAAIIRARIVEETINRSELSQIDTELNSLHRSLEHALSCSPQDSYLWLLLFGLRNLQNGFKTENLEYLRMSYELGANEGWIALKRNPFAFSVYEGLDADLSERVIKEFIQLLRTGLYGEVADIFLGPAWRLRDIILPRLTAVPLRQREIFARIIRNRGIDVDVPGIPKERY